MTNDQRITKFQCPMTKQALRVLPNCPCSSDRLSIMLRDLLRHWSLVILPLLSLLRIDYQGDRSVVHQRHLHLRAEFTGLDRFAEVFGEPAQERFVERDRDLGPGGAAV